MCVKVTWVSKGADGVITHIGGYADDGKTLRWGLTVLEATRRVESGEWTFFVARPSADPVPVLVREREGKKFLTTAADDTQTNNLSQLPVESHPLTGIDPQWPLALPGPLRPALLELMNSAPGGTFTVVSPDKQGYFKIPGWTGRRPAKWLRIRCNSAFPADLEVYVEREPSMADYDETMHKLVKVQSDSLGQKKQVQDQGRGWYYWNLDVLDASYPRRFTPFVISLAAPDRYARGAGYTLYLRSLSYNSYCAGPSAALAIVLYRGVSQPPIPPSPTGGAKTPSRPQRAYKEGAFTVWSPLARIVGESKTSGSGDKTMRVTSPGDVGQAGWPQYCDVITSGVRRLCQPIGFAVLPGTGPAVDGVGFSPMEDYAVALAVLQPNVPGHHENVLFRFARLGSSGELPMDVPGFLTAPFSTVAPRIMFDKADQVALVVDANQAGSKVNPARARLIDLGSAASSLAVFEFADETKLSATVKKIGESSYEATVTTDRETRTVPLPKI